MYAYFSAKGVELKFTDTHNRVRGLPGRNSLERFLEAKKTLVIGVRRTLNFASCRPSAHYQLPLTTGCPGRCQYCYLHTTLGKNPYLRVYVNLEEILQSAASYIKQRAPEVTVFEGSATSDPLSVEHLTGSLSRAISFFAESEKGFFRFVTKQAAADSLEEVQHQGKTRVRFSMNVPYVENNFERGVPPVTKRLQAALSLRKAGFPVGFLIAPIFIFEGWKRQYSDLLKTIGEKWKEKTTEENYPPLPFPDPSFELISHRFTSRSKQNINALFPENNLPLDEEERQFKFGQFGYGKYVYPKDELEQMENHFFPLIEELFPGGKVEYLV